MRQSHIKEWGEYNRRVEKRQEKLKVLVRDASYKVKSKFVIIRRNIQHFTGTVL